MMKKTQICLRRLALVTLPLVVLLSDATGLPGRSVKPKATSAERGLVWRIEGGKAPVYLVGSFHLLRKRDMPYPSAIEAAYSACEQVWFEIPPEEMAKPEVALKMMTAGALPGNKVLKEVVSPDTFRKIEDWPGDPAVKLMLNKMRPWMAALTITMLEYQKIGADPRYGIETFYQEKAKKDSKPTNGLETVDFQIGIFSKFTDEQQEAMLSQTFDELEESLKMIDDLISAWRKGDEQKLAQLIDEGFKGYPEIKSIMLTDRNARWIEPIEKLLAGDKPTMMIVGAGHLCGDDGVVKLLEKKRWKLTRVEGDKVK